MFCNELDEVLLCFVTNWSDPLKILLLVSVYFDFMRHEICCFDPTRV